MLVIVNLPQDRVIAILETRAVAASIGPTSPTGWTTVWSIDEVWSSEEPSRSGEGQDLLPAGCGARYFAIDEIAEGLQLDVFGGAGEVLHHVWSYDPKVVPLAQVEAVAAGLTTMFSCHDRQRDVEELFRGEPLDPEELVESLDSLLNLPELEEPAPPVAAVAYRGEPRFARLAASIAGPAYLKAGSGRWTTLVASGEDESRSIELAAGVSGAGGRRDVVVLIWRDGSGSGWSLWRRGNPVASGSWNGRWRHLESDPLRAEVETVKPIVKALGPQVDENSLRALLRSSRADHDPQAEFVALLNLPSDLLEAVDNPERFGEGTGVEYVEKSSVRKAVFQGARGDFDSGAPAKWRILLTGYAIGTVLAAGVCLAITALAVAVLVTDGAVANQTGVGGDDWAMLAMFGVLSLVLVPTAVVRMRRVRRRRQAERASG
jgi:hypothetical protein